MDAADIATDTTQALTEASLAQRTRYQGVSRLYCLECEEEIPEGRRQAIPGVELCVACQELEEGRQ